MSNLRMFGLLVVLALAPATFVGPAYACINVTKADLDESVRNLKIAEGALEANDLPKAQRWLQAASNTLSDMKAHVDPKDGKVHGPDGSTMPAPEPGLFRRAHRLRALLQSRGSRATAADQEAAVKTFEVEVLGANPDPAALADYGELLSRVPARAGQATMILRALRDKDLIGSAFAYAALARLEKDAGKADAETAARERCRTMAKKPAICG